MKALFWWTLGIAALAVLYALFELPGLLVGLFVGAVMVVANRWKLAQRQRGALSFIEIEGARINFPSMTMRKGEDEYALRRSENGKWERRAISEGAVAMAVAKRMNDFSDQQNAAASEKAAAMLVELAHGDPNAPIPTAELAKVMRSQAPGSVLRRALRDILEGHIRQAVAKGAFAQEDADKLFKIHEREEVLEAMKGWLEDDGGWEKLPMFEAPVETAYQRYIHQG